MARRNLDFSLLFAILALGSISLLVIFSTDKNLAFSQFIFWLIGLSIMGLVSFFDFRNWQKLALPFYFVTIAALFVLLFIGDPVRGSVRWIDLGAFRFQPSEIAKIASIILLASFYKERSARELKKVIVSFLLILPAIILVLIQPDIGNALAFVAIWFGISLVSGFRPKQILASILLMALVGMVLFRLLAPYQKERIESFVNPQRDPLATGYQIIQSKIAIGSGQFLGRGLGRGSQSQLNFLPEAESDFIFASIAEQLGFLGAALAIFLYTFITVKILSLIKETADFGQLITIGAVSYFLLQFLVNVGMNLGLVPVTGITFPLVSYGGSSLISTLFLLGIIFSVKRLSS